MLKFAANLPAHVGQGTTFNTTQKVYDTLGISHDIAFTWTAQGPVNNQWNVSAVCADANGALAGVPNWGAALASPLIRPRETSIRLMVQMLRL